MNKLLLLSLVLLFVGCGNSSSPEIAPRNDVTDAVAETVAEVTEHDVSQPEVTPDAVAEVVPELPDPDFVFEQLEHAQCLPDGPYEVDRSEQFRVPEQLAVLNVLSVLPYGDATLAGTAAGLYVRTAENDSFELLDLGAGGEFNESPVHDLQPRPGGGILATLVPGACQVVVVELSTSLEPGVVYELPGCGCDGEHFGAMECDGQTYILVGDDLVGKAGWCPGARHAQVMACFDSSAWLGDESGLYRAVGGEWVKKWPEEGDAAVVALAAGPDALYVAADDRVMARSEAGEWTEYLVGKGGLPTASFTRLAVGGNGKLLAIGHAIGATRVDLAEGRQDHYASPRELPLPTVNDVAFDQAGGLWVATPAGLARIYREETTLEAKAERYLEQLETHFWRMGGFLTSDAHFDDPWNDETAFLSDDDNDGQWTEEGVAAFCYAYAVTGDEKYYEAAHKAVTNMLMLIDVPASDFEAAGLGRGFVTRSLVRDDEGAIFENKATQSNWHLVHYEDGHDYYWKDDTSSDETTGHFYGLPIYYDLCAKDDEERAWVADRVGALAGTILDQGYQLVDLDGEVTTHGDWSPGRIAIAVDGLDACLADGHPMPDCIEAWMGAAHLDSIEVLGHMIAAWHVTGEARFLEAFNELIEVHRYDELAMFHDQVVTWTEVGLRNYCDHELADLSWLTLIRYDPDPDRRQMWIESMLAAWPHEAPERAPVKTLAMAAAVADVPGLAEGIQTLADYPEDLRTWEVDNSHRLDADTTADDRHGDPQFDTVFPYDEIRNLRWDQNPYRVTSPGNGTGRRNPAFWLWPYWGLRYYGVICP